METLLFPASGRGTKDIGWLKSNFFFSFSDYADPSKSAFGTLVAFNDDYLQQGKGFGIHPHVNMEIISIMLQGKMNHKDTMGYSTVVEEDGVQIMSAGSGLRHEEYNVGEEEVNFLQIWIQPKLQNIKPRYQTRSFPKAKRKGQLKTIISNEEGQEHCWINQNAKFSLGYFDKGANIPYSFNPTNKCLYIFNIEGTIEVSNNATPQQTADRITLHPRDGAGIWATDKINIECLEDAQFLIIETVVNQK